jgi:hypothetical protein
MHVLQRASAKQKFVTLMRSAVYGGCAALRLLGGVHCPLKLNKTQLWRGLWSVTEATSQSDADRRERSRDLPGVTEFSEVDSGELVRIERSLARYFCPWPSRPAQVCASPK